MTYPSSFPGGVSTFTYTLDAMERPTNLTGNNNGTWTSGVTYNAANQITAATIPGGNETRSYNSLLQLTNVTVANPTSLKMTYNYSSTGNNGQIVSSVDGVSSETITYQYDVLKRLQSAAGAIWGESYVYDGYGNMTGMNPTGTAGAPSLNVAVALDSNNVPTNRIAATGVAYDNSGNQTAGFGGVSLTYDVANRVSAAAAGSQTSIYAYDSDNRRIYSVALYDLRDRTVVSLARPLRRMMLPIHIRNGERVTDSGRTLPRETARQNRQTRGVPVGKDACSTSDYSFRVISCHGAWHRDFAAQRRGP